MNSIDQKFPERKPVFGCGETTSHDVKIEIQERELKTPIIDKISAVEITSINKEIHLMIKKIADGSNVEKQKKVKATIGHNPKHPLPLKPPQQNLTQFHRGEKLKQLNIRSIKDVNMPTVVIPLANYWDY